MAQGRGVGAARLRAITAEIIADIGRHDLSVAAIAARHRVSTRYVNKLFEPDGVSFSEFVLGQRLVRAHGMLTEPRFSGDTISSIAFACGFGDLSYFNRVFRRTYGATPSDVRAAVVR
jgi:transcriptional regulator GlxA family with amidase domain